MRRMITILVLLAGAASQLSALDCPMKAPSGDAVGAVDEAGAHAHHQPDTLPRDAREAGERSPSPASHHSDADCRLLVSCAGAVLTDGAPTLAGDPAPAMTSPVRAADRNRAGVFPSQEPPPPRLPV